MKDMGIVRGSPEMAQPLVVGTDTVFVHTDIGPVTEDQNGNPVEMNFSIMKFSMKKMNLSSCWRNRPPPITA